MGFAELQDPLIKKEAPRIDAAFGEAFRVASLRLPAGPFKEKIPDLKGMMLEFLLAANSPLQDLKFMQVLRGCEDCDVEAVLSSLIESYMGRYEQG